MEGRGRADVAQQVSRHELYLFISLGEIVRGRIDSTVTRGSDAAQISGHNNTTAIEPSLDCHNISVFTDVRGII